MKLTAFFSDEDYALIRCASQRGKLSDNFKRDARSGEVTFTTQQPRKLCAQLERIVDFGATSAYDVFGVN